MTVELPNRVALTGLLARLRLRPASADRDRAIAAVERQIRQLAE